jgi:DNA-binding LacI/PurR family transcriptional regulator
MALGAMHEFRAAGLSIPQDISIVGFDDITFAALAHPPLTTVCSPRAEIGRKAIEALLATTKQSGSTGEEVKIRTYLVIRGTTAPPATAISVDLARSGQILAEKSQ